MRKKSRTRRVPKAETPAVLPVPEETAPEEIAPEEETPTLTEAESSEAEEQISDAEEQTPAMEEQPSPEDAHTPDEASRTDEQTLPEPSPEEPPQPSAKRPVSRAHYLWRGWWLAVCILTIAVLMGRIDAFGVAWRRQPWRAFGGAVAVGGFLGALPGLLAGVLPERPRLRRCVLALLFGAVWGVLG